MEGSLGIPGSADFVFHVIIRPEQAVHFKPLPVVELNRSPVLQGVAETPVSLLCLCGFIWVVCVHVHVSILLCLQVWMGLKLMPSLFLNCSLAVFFELGVSQSNPELIDLLNLSGQLALVIHCLLFFFLAGIIRMLLCLPSIYVGCGKSRLQSSSLPGKCIHHLAISVAPALPFNSHISSGKENPTFLPSLWCLQVRQPAWVASQHALVVTVLVQ